MHSSSIGTVGGGYARQLLYMSYKAYQVAFTFTFHAQDFIYGVGDGSKWSGSPWIRELRILGAHYLPIQ